MTDERKAEGGQRLTEQGTSLVEWVAAAVGGALFAAMIGYMIFAGLNETRGTPSIKISAASPVRQDGIFLIKFEAENVGKQTASGLVIRATLSLGEREIETSEVTLDYLPGGSVRAGGFFFKHDPQAYDLELKPVGYLDP